MKRATRRIFFALLFLLPSLVNADTVRLNSGRVHKGKFLGISEGQVRFKSQGKVLRFSLLEVVDLQIARPPEQPERRAPRKPPRPATRPVPRPAPSPPGKQPRPTPQPGATESKGRPVVPFKPLELPPANDSPAAHDGPIAGLPYHYIVPGWAQIREDRPVRGWLLAGLFAASVLRGIYYYNLLLDDFNQAQNDPLYHMYLAPRDTIFAERRREIERSTGAAALVFALHGLELLLFGRGADPPVAGPGHGDAGIRFHFAYTLRFDPGVFRESSGEF